MQPVIPNQLVNAMRLTAQALARKPVIVLFKNYIPWRLGECVSSIKHDSFVIFIVRNLQPADLFFVFLHEVAHVCILAQWVDLPDPEAGADELAKHWIQWAGEAHNENELIEKIGKVRRYHETNGNYIFTSGANRGMFLPMAAKAGG